MMSSESSWVAPVLVVGTGPAGLAAAAASVQQGQVVTLIDENAGPGGQIWRGGPAHWSDARADALWQLLKTHPHVRIVYGARVIAAPARQMLLLDTADGPQLIAWEKLIICSGARELLLPFPGWTLPGVTGAGGLQALIKGGMQVKGKRIIVAGSGPLLLAVAATVRRAGGQLLMIAEQRSTRELAIFSWHLLWRHRSKLFQSLRLFLQLRGVRYRHAATVLAASGEQRLGSVTLTHSGRQSEIECDILACGFGLLPNTELASLLGCVLHDGRVQVDDAQRTTQPDIYAAGEATGVGGVDKALAEGRIAGLAAAGAVPGQRDRMARAQALSFAALLSSGFPVSPALRKLCQPETIVCRCEDVTARQLSGYSDWRTAKLMTRAGMGPCQGRVCGVACQFLYGWTSPELRQPVFPAAAATLAAIGAAFDKDETK